MKLADKIKENIDLTLSGDLDFKSDTGIGTKFGKYKSMKPLTTKLDDLTVYSLYNVGKSNNRSDILKQIKTVANNPNDGVKEFITRSAIYASRIIRKEIQVNLIVTPKSSSDLTKLFVNELSKRLYVDVFVDSFQKVPDFSKVEINREHPKITDSIIKSLEKTIERAERDYNYTVTLFHPMHRKFIKNLFEVSDEKLLDKLYGSDVLIVDDILTSGTTMVNISDVVRNYGSDTVNGITIFKM